ncbi:hypothetical protein Tco_0992861 [Tanacetum coccineum]|uniref:Uncharacterized protein n=1 Tax=Tanacetum coccineum TaxID=301880 RepID=A0ABQ5F533_9ASTR
MNLKLLRSLPSEWKTHALIWRNKEEIETISLDDLYNNLKIYEPELTGSSSTSQNPQNVAFVSSNYINSNSNSTNNTNKADNTAYGITSQPNSPQLAREDLEQIDPGDLEEMDLQWEMAKQIIRDRYSSRQAGKCRAPRNQENRGRENSRRAMTVETPTKNALVAQDGIGGYDWSYQAKEEHPTNYALMAYTSLRSSSSSDSEEDWNFIPSKPDQKFMDKVVKSENMDVIAVVTPSNIKKVESNHESTNVKNYGDAVEPKTVRKNSFRPPVTEDWNSDDIVRRFVPQAVLTRSGKINTAGASINTAVRPVNTAGLKTNVNHPRPISNVYKKGYSKVTRPFNKYSANKYSIFNKKVNTVRVKDTIARDKVVGNPQQKEYKEKGFIDSGCSRHLTRNKYYLTEYEDYDGGFVSFGDGKGKNVQKHLSLITDERVFDDKPESHSGSMSSMKNLDDTFNFGDQFLHDKPTEDDQEKSKGREESDSMIPDPSHQTVTSTPPVIAPFIDVTSSEPSLLLRVARLEQEMSEVKKTDHSADVLASIRTQVPTAVDNYLGTKLDDALLKVLERHTADLIEKYSVLPGPESVKNQESEKSPKEIIKAKKEQGEEKQDSTYSIRSTDKVDLEEFDLKSALFRHMNKIKSANRNTANYRLYHALMEALITDEDAMDKEVADKVKDHKRKHDSDDDEDDDDDEGPSAGSNQGRSTKRRRSDSAASGSAKPPPKADDQSSKKPRESEASASKQHPTLSSTGWQITDTREAGVDSSMHRSDPESEHSEQSSDDISMQDEGNDSDMEDTDNAHIPKVSTTTWFKPIPESERPATPEPEWTIPPNDFPEPEHNWANAYATTYKVPEENKLQRKTYDIGSFIKWFCRRTGKKKLCKADLEGPAFNLVKAFHKNNVFLQYQMDECHKLLTNKVDLSNPEGHQIPQNINEPLPLGGPPGQVTIQPQFFFNKDLDYLLTGDKERKIALSISKLKAARYLDFGLEELVPSLWVESEREYDISAVYGITHWWFRRKEFYINKHSESSDREAVRSQMRILSVISVKVFEKYGYNYLREIILRRADYQEYKISEKDFKNLHPNDFEDLFLLNIQEKLNHLPKTDKISLHTAVNMWIRNLVIRNRVGDLQLGIESYQTKINLERPNWDAADYYFKEDYTIVPKPRAVVYRDRNDQRKLMRLNELHKFSDGTLTRVMEKLDQMVKDFHLYEYNKGMETRKWSEDDKRRSKDFITAIEKRLQIRRIYRSLESFVGGRIRDIDYRLINRTT